MCQLNLKTHSNKVISLFFWYVDQKAATIEIDKFQIEQISKISNPFNFMYFSAGNNEAAQKCCVCNRVQNDNQSVCTKMGAERCMPGWNPCSLRRRNPAWSLENCWRTGVNLSENNSKHYYFPNRTMDLLFCLA